MICKNHVQNNKVATYSISKKAKCGWVEFDLN